MISLFYIFMTALIIMVAWLAFEAGSQIIPSCPGDTVLWFNQNTHIYHLPG